MTRLTKITRFLLVLASVNMLSMLTLLPDLGFDAGFAIAQEGSSKKYKNVETSKKLSVGWECSGALDRIIGEKGPIFLAQAVDEMIANIKTTYIEMEEKIASAKTKSEETALRKLYEEMKSYDDLEIFQKSKIYWKDAERVLQNIEYFGDLCVSDYEKAQLWNLLAYTNFSLKNYKEAMNYYEKIVLAPGKDDAFRLDTRRNLARLYAQFERYEEAIAQYEIWAAQRATIESSDRLTMAQLYHLLGKDDKALEMTKLGIAEIKDYSDLFVRDDFWKLQLSIYFKRKNYTNVKSLIEKLNSTNPDWLY